MTKMANFLLFLFGLFLVSRCQELAPFIVWSNNDIAQNIPVTDDIGLIVNSLTNKINSNDRVVIFTSDELSFDQLSKYIYDSSESYKFNHLKSAMETSLSHYWTGIINNNDDWLLNLAHGRNIRYMNNNDQASQSSQEVIVVQLHDLSNQDDIIEKVLKNIDGSYLAIYTHSSLINQKHRVRRDIVEDIIVNKRVLTPRDLGADQPNDPTNHTTCRMGGEFMTFDRDQETNETTPCLLFCLNTITYNFVLDGESQINCTLDTPYSIRACCDLNYANASDSYCMGEADPFVQLNFLAALTNTSDNQCVANSSMSFEAADIMIKFLFPKENTSTVWSVHMESLVNITTESNGAQSQSFDNIRRVNPSMKLYQSFEVNEGLSYACSANEYNRYINRVDNYTNVTVILHSFQVQPYKVTTNMFASAYNCEGYFTPTTWMGIVTVSVLLLILYVSMLCVFSANTIDKFEDPRGQSISVEKLH